MKILVVVNNKSDWPLEHHGIEVVTAKDYIKEGQYSASSYYRVINLCNSYNYQTLGYYVSLIGSARGHKPQPSLTCIEDLKSPSMIRFISNEEEELIQKSLYKIVSDQFTLSIYFGKNVAKSYDRLASTLYKLFLTPFLQAKFTRHKNRWVLASVKPIPFNQIPKEHLQFAHDQTYSYLNRKKLPTHSVQYSRYDVAILFDPDEKHPPSDKRSLQKFIKAGEKLGVSVELIQKSDFGRVPEFDALLIRETTRVNHHTYRFARRALANGLEVIDDPLSILRCCNKVYLYELLERHRIPIPKTVIVDRDNAEHIAHTISYPCVIKQPDSAFSKGVIKLSNTKDFLLQAERLLDGSDLILVQEYMPTEFDWRVGVLDGEPLFCCQYYMVKNHWQICRTTKTGKMQAGGVQAFHMDEVDPKILKLAVRASNLIGNGLYGVDIKEVDGKYYVIEVNDNPNIDAGYEDTILKENLYLKIISTLCNRIDQKKAQIRKERHVSTSV